MTIETLPIGERLKRLEDALRPFAANVEYVNWLELDDDDYVDRPPFRAGDYRAAAAALSTLRKDEEGK